MPSFFERVNRIARAEISYAALNQDPEKAIEQALREMEQGLDQLRLAITQASSNQKRIESRLSQAQTEVSQWQDRAELAVKNGNDSLAQAALTHKKKWLGTVTTLTTQLKQHSDTVQTLNRQEGEYLGKLKEAYANKAALIARAKKASRSSLENTIAKMGTSTATAKFERMEEKVLQMEARSQAAAEWSGADLDEQFELLGLSEHEVDDELAAMRDQLLRPVSQEQAQVESTATTQPPDKPKDEVDAELEALKAKLDQL